MKRHSNVGVNGVACLALVFKCERRGASLIDRTPLPVSRLGRDNATAAPSPYYLAKCSL